MGRMRRSWLLSGICCAIFLLLTGCASQSDSERYTLQLGVACYNQSDTFLSQLIDRLKTDLAAAETDSFQTHIMVRDAAGSQRTQDDQVKELLDAGANVLCVNLVDRADPSEIIDLARERNVPIIFFNREPVAEDMRQWDQLYYVGADAKQSGQLQGELAADYITQHPQIDRNKDGKIQYVVLEGEPGHQDAIIRTETAVDTLKSLGVSLDKLGSGIANWNRAQAQNRMLQLISQHQSGIELVLANNDDMALGAIAAYQKLNYTESAMPVVLGIDGTDVGLEAILNHTLAATVYNDKEGQTAAILQLAQALVTGQGMDQIQFAKDHYIYLPYTKVTAENAAAYLAKSD